MWRRENQVEPEPRRADGREGKRKRVAGKVEPSGGERPAKREGREGAGQRRNSKGRGTGGMEGQRERQ